MRRHRARGALSTVLLLLLTLATGCAANRRDVLSMEERVTPLLRERGLSPAEITVPFALSPEMRRWVHERVPKAGEIQVRMEALLRSLLSRDGGVQLAYESGYTGTAQEVFASGRANCLAFTHLFIGLARELGLDAYYLRVEEVQSFEKAGDLVVASGHITAGFGSAADRKVLEFTEQPVGPYRLLTQVSDLTAVALFHSNRGAELIREGQLQEASVWLERAARIDPELPDGWVNLGVVRRRLGNLDGAEAAYRRALEADPQQAAAYQNLAALLGLRGRQKEANELLALLGKVKSRNPFAYLALGDLSLREGRPDEAERFYRKALSLDPKQAESHAALGEWALAKGREREARRWLKKAIGLDPANIRTHRLADRLGQRMPDSAAPTGRS